MSKPKLYGLGISPSVQRVFAAFAIKGVEYDLVEIDITKSERPSEFNSISPFGKVPVLSHDGNNIFESVVINEYINEVWPDPPLLPSDPGGRAYAREWITAFNRDFTDREGQFVHVERDKATKIAICKSVFPSLAKLDRELQGKQNLFLGDELSLVDIAIAPFTKGVRICSELTGDEHLKGYKNLLAYFDRLEAQPSLKEPVYSVPDEALKQFFTMILVDGVTVP